jgi:hypothetical protein
MTKELNTRLLAKAAELVELANAATGTRDFHAGMLVVNMEVVNVHGTLVSSWRVCLGAFCSKGATETMTEALDSLERVIKESSN